MSRCDTEPQQQQHGRWTHILSFLSKFSLEKWIKVLNESPTTSASDYRKWTVSVQSDETTISSFNFLRRRPFFFAKKVKSFQENFGDFDILNN